MRWGLGIHLKDIQLPEAQILRHYFLDLWADMCMSLSLCADYKHNSELMQGRDVYVFRGIIQICPFRLLLENVWTIGTTATDSRSFRLLCLLDHCPSMSCHFTSSHNQRR